MWSEVIGSALHKTNAEPQRVQKSWLDEYVARLAVIGGLHHSEIAKKVLGGSVKVFKACYDSWQQKGKEREKTEGETIHEAVPWNWPKLNWCQASGRKRNYLEKSHCITHKNYNKEVSYFSRHRHVGLGFILSSLGSTHFFSSLQLTELMAEIAGRIWVTSGTFKTWSCLSLLSRVLHCLPFQFYCCAQVPWPVLSSVLSSSSSQFPCVLAGIQIFERTACLSRPSELFWQKLHKQQRRRIVWCSSTHKRNFMPTFCQKSTGNSSRVTQYRDDMRHRNKYTRSMSSP